MRYLLLTILACTFLVAGTLFPAQEEEILDMTPTIEWSQESYTSGGWRWNHDKDVVAPMPLCVFVNHEPFDFQDELIGPQGELHPPVYSYPDDPTPVVKIEEPAYRDKNPDWHLFPFFRREQDPQEGGLPITWAPSISIDGSIIPMDGKRVATVEVCKHCKLFYLDIADR